MSNYEYSARGSLIEDVDGNIYNIVDLNEGNITPLEEKDIKGYNYPSQSCLVKDLDGKVYSIIDLYEGNKREITKEELRNYNYTPKSCLVENVDGSMSNLIDSIANFSPQEGEGADSKRLRRVEKEIIQARTGINGIAYGTLDGRLDMEIRYVEDRSVATLQGVREILNTNYSLLDSNYKLDNKTTELKEENEQLKEVNKVQDTLIDTTMVATDEMYTMIESLLPQEIIDTMIVKGGSKMVEMYVAMIQRGLKTIEEIPMRYRTKVKEILDELEK